MTALFFILWATDLLLFMIAVDSTISNGIGGMVLFASEVSHASWDQLCSEPRLVRYSHGYCREHGREVSSVRL
jgi:hypothetical protein